ncbi:MAG: Hsp20/alpha crystallin family protein, partial [bacterium]|nr:Hsp20/alpha crystallin family protein [bacterium]
KVENYFCQECYWGKFSREIILPVETDTAKSEAVIKNGILTITVPKIKREKIKKLGIKEIE